MISCVTRLVVDGFPHLEENEYLKALRQHIRARQALILKDGNTAVGAALVSGAHEDEPKKDGGAA